MSAGYFIGIDPGQTGGIAVLKKDGSLHSLSIMPLDEDGEVSTAGVREILPTLIFHPPLIVCEHVWAMPGQGVSSMFKFGRLSGKVIGVVEAFYRTTCFQIAPQSWQKALWGRVLDPKEAARGWVKAHFPEANVLVSKDTGKPSTRVKNPHQGLVDALCLADYAQRNEAHLTGK